MSRDHGGVPGPPVAALLGTLRGEAWGLEAGTEAPVREALLSRGLAPLAVSEWRARNPGGDLSALPPDLVAAYHRSAFHTTVTLESGARALAALAQAGIPAVAFKGAALVWSGVYPEPGARPLDDVDLLVTAEAAPEAMRVLAREGFRPWASWSQDRMEWLPSATLSDTGAPPGIEVTLDLHWATPYTRLRAAPPWEPDPLWEGARGSLPGPEAHLALTAEHFLKHLRVVRHLRGLADVVRLLDWIEDPGALAEQARARGSFPGLQALVRTVREELGVPVPSEVVRACGLRGSAADGGRRVPLARLLARPGQDGADRAGGLLRDWALLQSRGDAVWEVARVLWPRGGWLRARYPDARPPRRVRYLQELVAWITGRGPSPLAPNQEFL